MYFLGLSCYYHDASATLLKDGIIIAAAEEERFTRKKHDSSFPVNAIGFCLDEAGISGKEIDAVCFYEKPFRKLERILQIAKLWPEESKDYIKRQLSYLLNERFFLDRLLEETTGYTGEIFYVEHHLAHAASAYYISPFKSAAILTIDGVGEWATTVCYSAEESKIRKWREIRYPDSLGLLYSTFTAFLGFRVNNDEYKVMGLASYGKPCYYDKIKSIVEIYPDGSFKLDLDYFSYMYDDTRMYSEKFIETFGEPRVPESEISQDHMDLAASVQKLTEEILVKLGNSLYELVGGNENVCLAGGVSLNSVANWKFIQQTPFKNICIQPAAGDGGGSMGAVLYYYYNQVTGVKKPTYRHTSFYGPEYSNQEIEIMLRDRHADFQYLPDDQLCRKAAELVYKDQIIGWFQGRMEFGPRALGNRSIIANPCNSSMKDILNERVKFREDFRPFAPAVLSDKSWEYFDCPMESPHMLFVTPVMPGKGESIPSVTHIDGSARLQTVNVEDNPRFYQLIGEFEKLSGIPVVINTSFNIRGEPIVCTPLDAYNCFMKTDIDFLFIGNYFVKKGF